MARRTPQYVSGVSDVAGTESLPYLSVSADHVPSAADFSPPEQFASSSNDLQRQILEVEQQIEALSASKKSVRSGMARHSLPVGGHFSHRGLSQGPMTDTDNTLPKLSGQPDSVTADRSASFEPTVGDDFVHNPHTGGSIGEFVTHRRPRQLGRPVGERCGFSAGFETLGQARRLPEIPVSSTARVLNGSSGEFVTPRQPGFLGHPGVILRLPQWWQRPRLCPKIRWVSQGPSDDQTACF